MEWPKYYSKNFCDSHPFMSVHFTFQSFLHIFSHFMGILKKTFSKNEFYPIEFTLYTCMWLHVRRFRFFGSMPNPRSHVMFFYNLSHVLAFKGFYALRVKFRHENHVGDQYKQYPLRQKPYFGIFKQPYNWQVSSDILAL